MNDANKITKLVLSLLMTISCINFSTVQAEDSEPAATAIPAEEVIAEPTPTTEGSTEEVLPAASPAAEATAVPELVEDKNSDPVPTAAPVPTEEPGVEQQEAPVEPEIEKVETVEEVKVTVVVSYVDENDHPLIDPIIGSYPTEYRLDENVDAFKSFDGYAFEKVIVNDDAKNTISKDDVQKNGLRITKDMTSLKLVYQKMNLESNENKEVIPEVTEEASEEAEPESNTNETELSAFDQTAFAGNVTVHVTAAEGVLPSGAQLIVKRVTRKAILNAVEETVTEKDKEVDSAIALDITIVNADGIEIQPNGIVNVSFENVAVGGEEVNIYHVTDDASTVTEVAANTQSFDANHFSIYVITGEKKVELTTFNFVAEGNTVSTQIVKTGDTLITPTAPDIAGKAFVEWQENGSKFDGFGEQTITKTETRTITAKYEDALYVYFYNPEGTQIMRTEKVADHKGHDYSNVSYDVDATHKLVGWAAEVNGTKDIAKNITVPEGSTSVNVYAIIKEGYWVSFDSDGGSAIDSQFVFDKISLNDQTTPTKPGYTFVGWYDGTTKVDDGAAFSSPMTLKAHWEAKEVSYTVIHWWENADDDGYSFHESENKTGLTGTEANAKAKSYEGFTAQPVTKKTIKGDGSTIISVCYKRNVYEVKFYSYTTYDWRGRPVTPSKEYEDLRITAKYGQDISKQWPTYSGSSTWSTKDNGSTYQANINTMPLGGAKFYGPQTGNYYCEALYYVEILPGENSSITVGGIKYRLDHTDKMYGSNITITKEDLYPLKGFTLNESISARIGQKYNGAKFYYTRNSYDLKFINNGKPDRTVTKKYEQSISNENYTPTRPSSLPEYYVFDGWYENELCEGEAYNFTGKKMPAQNVTLYAKWTAKKINLTYNLNNPEGTVDKDNKKVEAGTVASTVLPSIPTINEYSFAGWYYADGNGNITSEVFNTNNTITRDTSIVGKWLYKGELRVVYDPGSETGATVPTDGKVYAGGAKVTVAGNATTTENMKFLGWELNGNVYKPGQSFEVNKDIANKDNQIILTATWGDAETSTTLTYNPGNGIGTAKRVDVMNNEAVEIETHGSLGFKAPVEEGKEYYFAGWTDSSTGNATYADGQTINIDANGENVLYAVWVEKTVITLEAKVDTKTYNGQVQTLEGFKNTTVDGYTVSGLTATTSGKDAQVYSNTAFAGTAKVEKDGVDVTDKVVVKTVPGQLTINPRPVTVAAENKTKVYGAADPELTATVTGTLNNDKVDYTLTREPGEDVRTYVINVTGDEDQGNYHVAYTAGEFEITKSGELKLTAELTGESATKVYDGNPLTGGATANVKEGTTITYSTDSGTTWTTEVPSITNVGTLNITARAENSNYEPAETTYSLTVTHATATVTADDKTKTYGEADPEFTANVKGVIETEKDTVQIAYNKPLTRDAGEAKGIYTIHVDGEEYQGNYHVEYVAGTLEITRKSLEDEDSGIEVTNPDDTIYDGTSQKLKPTVVDTKTGDTLTEGTDYYLDYSEDTTNVGTVAIMIKGTGNYSGSKAASYKITPRTVKLESEDATKPYDGTPLTRPTVTVTGDGFVEGEVADITATGTITNVGSVENTITYTRLDKFKESNYIVSEDTGTLTVTQQTIDPEDPDPEKEYLGVTVDTPSDVTYDGNEHKWTPTVLDADEKALTEGTDYTVSYDTADFTNVHTITVTIEGIGNYTGTVTRTYRITPATVTVTANNTGKVYGEADPELTAKVEGTIGNDEVVFKLERNPGEDVGTYVINVTGDEDQGNYRVTYTAGEFEITKSGELKLTAELTGESATKVYDGNPLTGGATANVKEGTTITYSTDSGTTWTTEVPSITNVGTLNITARAENSNYEPAETTYSLTVTHATATVTADDKTKTYGEADPEFTANVKGVIETEKDTVQIAYNKPLTRDAGEAKGIYTIHVDGEEYQGNYHVEYVAGTLEITRKSLEDEDSGIEVTNPDDTIYDGTSQKLKPTVVDTKTGDTLTEGTDYYLDYSEDTTNVGTVAIMIKGTGNYSGSKAASYKITPRTVKLESEDATKPYDGTPLTRPTVTVTGDGFVEGEVADITATGTITNVGSVENTITYTRLDKFKESNYIVSEDTGTLTVTQQTIDPEDPDPEKEYLGVTVDTPSDVTYDGNEHKWTPTVLDADEKALTEGTDYTVSYDTADFTNVHTITVTIEGIGNYTGTVTRTYRITPATVTVTANNTGKVYGEADPELTAKVEGTIGNDEVVFKLERNPGEDVGTYVINVTGDEDQGNYRVTYTAGEFEITPKSIIPVTPEEPGKDANITVETPEDVKYNGESQQQKPVIKDDKGNVLEEGKDYTLEFSEDTTNAGTVTVTVTGINNYEGTFDVHYNILPRDITMTSGNAEKVYDGTALTNGEIVITGDGFVEGEGVTYNVTGTQTEVGSSANTFDYTFNENTLASNYKVTTVNGTLTVTPQQVVSVTPPQPPVNPGSEVTPQDTPTTAEVQTPTTTITEQKTPQTAPKKTETIKNDPTPEAAGKAYWALINLICAAVTVVLAIFALLSKHKKEEDAKEDEDTDAQTVMSTEEDEEDPEISKRHRIWKVVGAVDAIVAVIVFFLTENMSLPMALTDKWTVLMVVFALISVVTTVLAKKWHKKDDDNAENSEEQNTLQNA